MWPAQRDEFTLPAARCKNKNNAIRTTHGINPANNNVRPRSDEGCGISFFDLARDTAARVTSATPPSITNETKSGTAHAERPPSEVRALGGSRRRLFATLIIPPPALSKNNEGRPATSGIDISFRTRARSAMSHNRSKTRKAMASFLPGPHTITFPPVSRQRREQKHMTTDVATHVATTATHA